MKLADLSSFTRVVIVDNDEDDGLGIRSALDVNHIPSLFIHAEGRGALPKEPFPNVRLVFLDLNMIPVAASNERAIATYALTFLSKVVGDHNFYILILWSSHIGQSLETVFLDMINEDRFSNIRPVVPPIPITKSECKKADNKYSVQKMNRFIKEGIETVSNYALLTRWEIAIDQVMSQFLSSLLSDQDQVNISKKLHALAEAYAGTGYKKNISRHALLALNDALKGSIDGEINSQDYSKNNSKIDPSPGVLSVDDMAEINEKLILNPEVSVGPGCVLKAVSQKRMGTLFTASSARGITNVHVNVTPICDVAQDKNEFSYYVDGVITAHDDKKIKRADYVYAFKNSFMYNGQNVIIVLNLKTFHSVEKKPRTRPTYRKMKDREGNSVDVLVPANKVETEANVMFKLRDNVVTDFQHKIAAYNARPGHILLS
jgi:hypothetical protein